MSALRDFAASVGSSALIVARSVRALLGLRLPPGSLRAQLWSIGAQSLVIVVVCTAFLGAVLVLGAGMRLRPLVGDPVMFGPAVLELIVREFGPTFAAIVLATRVGAGVAAEIAAMAVSEQVDALRLCAADPIEELVAPRALAGFVATLVMAAAGTAAAAYSGAYVGSWAFGSRPGAYLDPLLLDSGDFAVALLKSAAYGLVITPIAARHGLAASGGAPAVGRATTGGVVESIVAVIALDLLIGGAALGVGL
jgi:phospholipid/cholesterol/gamma-HCH transport system permease protein